MTTTEILDFLWNPKNVKNCKECPYNDHEQNSWLPCGQQNCWVSVHVALLGSNGDSEDEE